MAEQIIKNFDMEKEDKKTPNSNKWSEIILGAIILVFAMVLGRFAAQITVRDRSDLPAVTYTQESKAGVKSYGQKNQKLCPDRAEGTVKRGGIDGEGTHHLVRKGGKDQYVYLTSSTVDLSLVENQKVAVWGKTYAAKTAGWLMDICYLEVK